MISNLSEDFNFNQLYLKLNWLIYKYRSVFPIHYFEKWKWNVDAIKNHLFHMNSNFGHNYHFFSLVT